MRKTFFYLGPGGPSGHQQWEAVRDGQLDVGAKPADLPEYYTWIGFLCRL